MIDIAKFLSKKLGPIYTYISNVWKCLFPNLLDNWVFDLWKLSTWWGKMHFIVLIFNSFIIREIDHLFECCSCFFEFFFSLIVAAISSLWIVNLSLSYFSFKWSLSFNFICNVFYYKICKTSNCLSFPLWLLGLICHL